MCEAKADPKVESALQEEIQAGKELKAAARTVDGAGAARSRDMAMVGEGGLDTDRNRNTPKTTVQM